MNDSRLESPLGRKAGEEGLGLELRVKTQQTRLKPGGDCRIFFRISTLNFYHSDFYTF